MSKVSLLIIILICNLQSHLCLAQTEEIVKSKNVMVIDTLGNPMSGVAIIKYNSESGAVSDFEGELNLDVEIDDTLVLSYLGYSSFNLKVSKDFLVESENGIKNIILMIGENGIQSRYWCCTSHSETIHCNKNIDYLKNYHSDSEIYEIQY